MGNRAARKFIEDKQLLLIGSPPCTLWSTWQRTNSKRDLKKYAKELEQARVHLQFVCKLYKKHMKAGRLLLHEHPAYASPWSGHTVKAPLDRDQVDREITHQRQYGQRDSRVEFIKKTTGWMGKFMSSS